MRELLVVLVILSILCSFVVAASITQTDIQTSISQGLAQSQPIPIPGAPEESSSPELPSSQPIPIPSTSEESLLSDLSGSDTSSIETSDNGQGPSSQDSMLSANLSQLTISTEDRPVPPEDMRPEAPLTSPSSGKGAPAAVQTTVKIDSYTQRYLDEFRRLDEFKKRYTGQCRAPDKIASSPQTNSTPKDSDLVLLPITPPLPAVKKATGNWVRAVPDCSSRPAQHAQQSPIRRAEKTCPEEGVTPNHNGDTWASDLSESNLTPTGMFYIEGFSLPQESMLSANLSQLTISTVDRPVLQECTRPETPTSSGKGAPAAVHQTIAGQDPHTRRIADEPHRLDDFRRHASQVRASDKIASIPQSNQIPEDGDPAPAPSPRAINSTENRARAAPDHRRNRPAPRSDQLPRRKQPKEPAQQAQQPLIRRTEKLRLKKGVACSFNGDTSASDLSELSPIQTGIFHIEGVSPPHDSMLSAHFAQLTISAADRPVPPEDMRPEAPLTSPSSGKGAPAAVHQTTVELDTYAPRYLDQLRGSEPKKRVSGQIQAPDNVASSPQSDSKNSDLALPQIVSLSPRVRKSTSSWTRTAPDDKKSRPAPQSDQMIRRKRIEDPGQQAQRPPIRKTKEACSKEGVVSETSRLPRSKPQLVIVGFELPADKGSSANAPSNKTEIFGSISTNEEGSYSSVRWLLSKKTIHGQPNLYTSKETPGKRLEVPDSNRISAAKENKENLGYCPKGLMPGLAEAVIGRLLVNGEVLSEDGEFSAEHVSATNKQIYATDGLLASRARRNVAWYDIFVYFFVENVPIASESDDLLFFVRASSWPVKHDRQVKAAIAPVVIKRKLPGFVMPPLDFPVAWEETLYLNLVCQLHYTLSVSVCRDELVAGAVQRILIQQIKRRVYASPSHLRPDSNDKPLEDTFPFIYFSVADFDNCFGNFHVASGEVLCVELVADISETPEATPEDCRAKQRKFYSMQNKDVLPLFQGAVPYDCLVQAYRAKHVSPNESELILMRGPNGKGIAWLWLYRYLLNHIGLAQVSVINPIHESKPSTASSVLATIRRMRGSKPRPPKLPDYLKCCLTFVNLHWRLVIIDLFQHFSAKP